jgi:signal peptidase II
VSKGTRVNQVKRRQAGFALLAGASRWIALALPILALDQWTKRLIVERLEPYDEIAVLPVLAIVRWHNEGAAWSMLSDAGGWQRWFFTVLGIGVSIGILFWLRRLPVTGQARVAAGLALVMAGAIGNVVDRLSYGFVIDFIKVHYAGWVFPAFNVADSAITIGAALIILDAVIDYGRGGAKRQS